MTTPTDDEPNDNRLAQWIRVVAAYKGLTLKQASAELDIPDYKMSRILSRRCRVRREDANALSAWGAPFGEPSAGDILMWRDDPALPPNDFNRLLHRTRITLV